MGDVPDRYANGDAGSDFALYSRRPFWQRRFTL
jgi:hypothetical protein